MKDLNKYTCYKCKYYATCGDATRTELCKGKVTLPTEQECLLIGVTIVQLFGTGWCCDAWSIADRMGYSIGDMETILWECVKYPSNPITRADGKFAW